MRRRTLTTTVIALVTVLVLAPLVAVWFLASTERGLATIARQLDRLERFGIHTEGVSGTLLGPLHIKRIEIDLQSAHVLIEDVTATLNGTALFWQTVDIRAMSVGSAQVQLKNAPDTPPNPEPPQFLPSFLRVVADRVTVARARLRLADGKSSYESSRLETALRMTSRELRINDVLLVMPQLGLRGELQLKAQRPLGLNSRINANLLSPRNKTLALTAQTRGDLENLQVSLRMLAPSIASVTATIKRKDDTWSISGDAASEDLSLAPWLETPPFSVRNAAFTFSASDRDSTLRGEALLPQVSTLPITLDATGSFAQRVLAITKSRVALKGTATEVNVAGSVKLLDDGPELDLTSQWKSLQWPLAGERPLIRSDGRARITGKEPFAFVITASAASERKELRIPAMQGEVAGSLSRAELLLQRYSIDTLGGNLHGDGRLVLQAPREWRVQVNAKDIDPQLIHAQFPGRVAFALVGQGQGVDSKARFKAQLQQLSGTLRSRTLTGHGTLERTAQGWAFDDVAAALGSARLAASGRWEQSLDIKMNFVADALKDLFPDAAGRVRFDGHAAGTIDAPAIAATLSADGFRYQDWTAASVIGKVDMHLGSAAQHSSFQITAQRAGTAGVMVQAIQISGDGTAQHNELQLTASARPSSQGYVPWSVKLAVAGKYEKGAWTGTLTTAEHSRNYGTQKITLQHPAALHVAADRISAEPVCLLFAEKPLCVQGFWNKEGQWSMHADGDDIPLQAFNADNEDDAHFTGSWGLHLNAAAESAKPWTADGRMNLNAATAAYKPLLAEVETFRIGTGEAVLHAAAEEITASLKLSSGDETALNASAHLDRKSTEAVMHMPLRAQLQGRTNQIQMLPVLIADIDRAAGSVDADMSISGTLAEPELAGSIKLHDGELDLYRINLALRAVQLTVQLASNQLMLDGEARAGEGTLAVNGTLAWTNNAPHGALNVKGDNLLIADLPEYRVVASPNIKFMVDGRKIDATGEIAIPSAKIQPVDLRGAKQVSADARLMNEARTDQNSGFSVHSEIKIVMGKDVEINAFGLQGQLGGNVSTTIGGQAAVGRGELSISNGKYEAYGQKLDITRGRLLFDETPLDDPGLDVVAERKMEAQSIKVGLNVRGTLHAPRVSFFSDPSMSQTRILSYLLVGTSVEDAQTAQTAGSTSTGSSLALQGGGYLASKIGERIGLQQVGVESDSTNNTSLVLGRFLSPRLFVSYGISLTESINTVKLRYTINDHWTLKTEHGGHQSADLEYTIEKD